MEDTLIKVEGLSKKFCRSLKKSMWYGMQDIGSELLGRRHGKDGVLRADEFWATKDVSFEVKRGECLGLIGHNGAGKTTLLRMLNGLIRPDQGRIEMRGKVGALIALGAGFNPILTGRENIYINASVLGMSKQYVDSKIDEIIDFAEIRDFINSPVQTYSSGMNVRLGFAVAAILIKPDILFLDEVLAVGDINFVIKCLNTVRDLSKNASVVFVSHNMQQISAFCSRVLVLENGRVLADCQNPSDGIDRYFELIKHTQHTSGTGKAEILSLELAVNNQLLIDAKPSLLQGIEASAILGVRIDDANCHVNILMIVRDESLSPIMALPLNQQNGDMKCISTGEHRLEIPLGNIDLNSGSYSFVVAVTDRDTRVVHARVEGLCSFRVTANRHYWGKVVRPVMPRITSGQDIEI